MRGCPATIRAANFVAGEPSSACAAIHRRRFGRPVACAGVPRAARRHSPLAPAPARVRAPLALSCDGPAPDPTARRSTPFDGEMHPSAEQLSHRQGSCTALRRPCADTAARRSTSFDGELHPSAEQLSHRQGSCTALRRPCAGYRYPMTNTLRREVAPIGGDLHPSAVELHPSTGIIRRATRLLPSSMPISRCLPDALKTTVKSITNHLDKSNTTEYNSIVNKKRAIGRSPCGKEGRCL